MRSRQKVSRLMLFTSSYWELSIYLYTHTHTHTHTHRHRHTYIHTQCIRKVFTLYFFHISLCYSLIPKWIKFIIFLKILQTIPHNDNVKELCLKSLQIYKKKKNNHMYISIHSLCHDTQNWAQVHPVSTDHPWDVSTTWLESTCGKFSWLDMI